MWSKPFYILQVDLIFATHVVITENIFANRNFILPFSLTQMISHFKDNSLHSEKWPYDVTLFCPCAKGLAQTKFQIGVQYMFLGNNWICTYFLWISSIKTERPQWLDPVILSSFCFFFLLLSKLKHITEEIIMITNYPPWPWVQPVASTVMVMMIEFVLTYTFRKWR